MPRDAQRRTLESQDSGVADAYEIFAGLWEQAAFPRLPRDAPPGLKEYVEDVEDPKRVFTIHRASRRHNFQLLVQKFIVQLRDGCGSINCDTPTCFSCRKRIVGRAPARRYNSTSARTIAVFLASQDNPESALCPSLRPPKTTPAVLSSLIISAKPGAVGREDRTSQGRVSQNGHARGTLSKGMLNTASATNPHPSPSPSPSPSSSPSSSSSQRSDRNQGQQPSATAPGRPPGPAKFTIAEKPVNKDYRSFAANMFGTVAFKMLEWLTPMSLDELSRKASEFNGEPATRVSGPKPRPKSGPPSARAAEMNGNGEKPTGDKRDKTHSSTSAPTSASASSTTPPTTNGNHSSPSRPANTRRNSNTGRVRTSTSAKPKRNLSLDAFPPDHLVATEELISTLKSPRVPSLPQEKPARTPLKPAAPANPRPISQLSGTGILDGVPLEKMPQAKSMAADCRPATKMGRGQLGGVPKRNGPDGTEGAAARPSPRAPPSESPQVGASPCSGGDSEKAAFEETCRRFLPQSAGQLTPDLVDFFCDVLQDDYTAETHLLEPKSVARSHPVRAGHSMRPRPDVRRRIESPESYPAHMRYRWMLFVEQSFFYVLSDPRRLIQSFTTRAGQLYDSNTLWYCMLRMSRVAPTVVMHAVWMAAEALFVPPRSVQSLASSPRTPRSPTIAGSAAAASSGTGSSRPFPRQHQQHQHQQQEEDPLSSTEAGFLLSICMHLLMALPPATFKKESLLDMSRIRSLGLVLARTGAVARQSSDLCLAYNDAFTNDLAQRLARRLFSAIATRRLYGDVAALGGDHGGGGSDGGSDDVSSSDGSDAARAAGVAGVAGVAARPDDILHPLFLQMDFLNAEIAYILYFSIPHRAIHEIRAPTLLLDWARSVMMNEWDGRAEVPGDGPFGGALALMKAMYDKRRLLVLADGQFRAEYFSDRLDEVEMPVAWLAFTSTKQKVHLLDYPFLFSPSTLVSYFRSINFSRMSRYFEESSCVQSRMGAMIPPLGNLVIDTHHKQVLSDMLRTASSKYLVLRISREQALEDAFNQLWRREERELMRPLKVRLGEATGEEGFDSGGVQQEFFRMAMAEALNPDFGAFTVDERTQMTWFNPGSPEPDWKYELIGLLVSLAVYNGLTLPVTFPLALYCKLLGEPVTELHHISDGWPELASGLTALLEWDERDGTVEDVFSRTYEFSISVFGEPISREMKSAANNNNNADANTKSSGSGKNKVPGRQVYEWPSFPGKRNQAAAIFGYALAEASLCNERPMHEGNPTEAPMVTRENRDAYVSDYIRYLTDVSVRSQYEAFARGFRTCLPARSLTLLTPRLLQSVVEGTQEIDVSELRRHARYVGWDASHRTVRDFWSVVRRFDEGMKRRLLEFVTASDRVPVGGVKNVQFVIQRNGEVEGEGGHLPTAYTCYGTLLLPQYKDREVLRERLCMALENAQGFGFA